MKTIDLGTFDIVTDQTFTAWLFSDLRDELEYLTGHRGFEWPMNVELRSGASTTSYDFDRTRLLRGGPSLAFNSAAPLKIGFTDARGRKERATMTVEGIYEGLGWALRYEMFGGQCRVLVRDPTMSADTDRVQ